MAYEVKVPAVGESISEVVIARWLKQDGDFVTAEDLICEIESDKASFEIPAEQSGKLKILAQEGETIAVGSPIASIDTEAADNGAAQPEPAGTSEKPESGAKPAVEKTEEKKAESTSADKSSSGSEGGSAHEVIIPAVGESISEVTIAKWLKADGSRVDADDLICEIESDKASFEIPAEHGGVLHIGSGEGETVAVGSVIAEIRGGSDGKQTPPAGDGKSTQVTPEKSTPATDRHVKTSPVAAKILESAGISSENISGSGPGGRITKEDAMKAVQSAQDRQSAPGPTAAATTPSPKVEQPAAEAGDRASRSERMSTLRKTIARRLVAAKNQTAMLTTFNEVDMSAIKNLRTLYKDMFKEKHEIGLGFMSFFTRAVCLALQEWPAVNAMIDEENESLVYHDYCDIAIAVSSPRGLVVPVIRNAEQLSLAGIEKEVLQLAKKARDGKLTIEEMTGGTFTITNGGVFGSMMSTPIINVPQSAILGMHNIVDRPVVVDGEIVVRPMMYLALSYDHRIIDGRESVSFLVRVKQHLEDPARMLLEV